MPARPEPRTFFRAWGGTLSASGGVSSWAVTVNLPPLHISQEVIGLSCEARFNSLPGHDPFHVSKLLSVRANPLCQVTRLAYIPDFSIVPFGSSGIALVPVEDHLARVFHA